MAPNVPKTYKDLPNIKITSLYRDKNWLEVLVEFLFLGQSQWTGYYNSIGAKRRVIAALIQTGWSITLLATAGLTLLESSKLIDKSNVVNACGIIAAIFGATFFREMKEIHSKWDYLAKTFNDIIKLPPPPKDGTTPTDEKKYSPRDHLAACLAHDILVMNMWAHRSFRAFFKEIIVKAVIKRHEVNPTEITRQLEEIAKNGIDLRRVESLIQDYLEDVRDDTDRPHVEMRVAS